MEIIYHWESDYLIPDLKLSDTTEYNIGKYGRMRQRFLQENYRGIYSYMLLLETLWKHLAEIKNANGRILKKSKSGIDRIGKIAYH